MTVTTPTPDENDENAKAVLAAAAAVIESEQEQVNVEAIFKLAFRVGVGLKGWRKLMLDPEAQGESSVFPEQWVDETAMIIFHKFFKPYDAIDEDEIIDRMHDHFETWHRDN